MRLFLRHKLLAGVLAVVVAAAAAGGAYAATQSSSSPQQAYLKDVAKRLHVSPAKLSSALKGALIDRLNAMVNSGQLTQAQASKIEQGFSKGGAAPFFFGGGPGGKFRMGGHGFGMRMADGGPLHAAASYLGLSDTQLLTDLASGKSLAQVATKQGKSVTGLEQAIITAAKTRLDKLVSKGILTSAQERRVLSHLSARIDKLVNRSGHLRVERPGLMMSAPPGAPMPPAGAPGPGGMSGSASGASGSGPNFGPPPPSA